MVPTQLQNIKLLRSTHRTDSLAVYNELPEFEEYLKTMTR